MGSLVRSVDTVLFLSFLFVVVTAPLVHYEDWLRLSDDEAPQFLLDLKNYYSGPLGHYLLLEKPWFFVGLVWLELLVLWPLSVANVYAIYASKPWFNTSCLISGVTLISSMAAIIPELFGSGKASYKILMVYFSFSGFDILAILRGLLTNTMTIKTPAQVIKSAKMA